MEKVVHAIRKAVEKGFPLFIKMNCQDFAENGLSLEDSLNLCFGPGLEGGGICCVSREHEKTK